VHHVIQWLEVPVVAVFSGLLALALTIVILGPAVGVLLRKGHLEIEVDGNAARAEPRLDDQDGQHRYRQFLDLGFRPFGWTRKHARFLTPLHWRWSAYEGTRWLASADDRTFVSFYRLVRDEPLRIGLMTSFEGGGAWLTSSPGAGIDDPADGNYGRAEERGVDAPELLARHEHHVEVFRAQRGLAIRQATMADVGAESLALEHALKALEKGRSLLAMPLGLFAMPAAVCLVMMAQGPARRAMGLLGILYAAALYGLMLALLHVVHPRTARRTHTRAFHLEQTSVARDGAIVPGRHERWLRALAVVAAADFASHGFLILWRAPQILARGRSATFMAGMYAAVAGLFVYIFVLRASGRVHRRKPIDGSDLTFNWILWVMFALILGDTATASLTSIRFPHAVAVLVLGALGWWLEKTSRT
jgi:hypothetical protein